MNNDLSFSEILEKKMRLTTACCKPLFNPTENRDLPPYTPSMNPIFFFDQAPKKQDFSPRKIKIYQNSAKFQTKKSEQTTKTEGTIPKNEAQKPKIQQSAPPIEETETPTFKINPLDLHTNEQIALHQLREFGALSLYRPTLTLKEIKKAYKTLSRKFHPDLHLDKSSREIQLYSEKFSTMRECYQVLREGFERQENTPPKEK